MVMTDDPCDLTVVFYLENPLADRGCSSGSAFLESAADRARKLLKHARREANLANVMN